MRSVLTFLLTLTLLVMSGCTKAQPTPQPTPPPAPQPAPQEPADAAEQVKRVALELLAARQQADRAAVDALLGDPTLKTRIGLPGEGLILTGYRIVEPLEGEGHPLKTQLFYHQVGQRAGYWVEELRFKYDGSKFLITNYSLLGERSVEIDNKQLTLNLPTGESQAWLTLDQLPESFKVDDDYEMGVSRAKFDDVALHQDGETVAFFSGGEVHGFLGLAGPEGKVTGLDAFFEGDGRELAFSADGKTLAAVVLHPSGMMALHAYDVTNKQRIEVSGVPQVEKIEGLRWTEENLTFTTTHQGKTEQWRWQPGQPASKG